MWLIAVFVGPGVKDGVKAIGRGLWRKFGQFFEGGIGLADCIEARLGLGELLLEAPKFGFFATEFGQSVDGFEEALFVVFGELLGLALQELCAGRGIVPFGQFGAEVDIAPEVAVLLVGMVEGAAGVDLDLGYFHGADFMLGNGPDGDCGSG